MNWHHIKTIFIKEFIDTIRDKKTLYVMIFLPILIIPLFMGGFQALMKANMEKEQKSVSQVAVRGYNGPLLQEIFTADSRVKIVKEVKKSNKQHDDFNNSNLNAVLEIPESLHKDLAQGKPVKMKVIFDAAIQSSAFAEQKIESALTKFNQKIVAQNLVKKGISPQILTPIISEPKNVAGEDKMGAMILSTILPLIIAMWTVIGGMYTAIDTAAGEKERETLEALLVAAPSRVSIVIGKFLTVLFGSVITVILVLISMVVTLMISPPQLGPGLASISLKISPLIYLLVLIIAVVLAAALSALMLALSIYAKNFKQAQNYITPLNFVIMVPAYALMAFPNFKPTNGMFLIPIFNAVISFKQLLMGEINWTHYGLVFLSSSVFAGISIYLAIRMFNSEKVIFKG